MKSDLYKENEVPNEEGCELGRKFINRIRDLLDDACVKHKIHEVHSTLIEELGCEIARRKIEQRFQEGKRNEV